MSKVLANRLALELPHIISINQSAFIKKRSIHDNFVYVQELTRALHKKNWPCLLEIMSYLGFGHRWTNWISALWCTTSSRFLLNGEPGKIILHAHGVRQGDPLSPMLFLLAMGPLYKMFKLAQQQGLISFLNMNSECFRFSLYADDATVFVKPTAQDLTILKTILDIFGEASGLHTDLEKAEVFPICCDNINIAQLLGEQQRISCFTCKYLGLPLHTRKLPKASIQPVIQKIADRLPGWKTDFLTCLGRDLLVKTVLTTMPTYFLTVFKFPR